MCSLCRLPVAKNHNFGQIVTFGGLPYRRPFADEGQIWCARSDPTSALTRQMSSECVYSVGFPWPKPQLWANFDFWGHSVYRCKPNLVCYSRPTVYAHVSNIVSIGLFYRPLLARNPNFCRFFGPAFSAVAN